MWPLTNKPDGGSQSLATAYRSSGEQRVSGYLIYLQTRLAWLASLSGVRGLGRIGEQEFLRLLQGAHSKIIYHTEET